MSLFNLEDSKGGTCSGSRLMLEGKVGNGCCDSESTSSIGKNSDVAGGEEESGGEVESPYKGGGALDAMEALEEALPIRRGISGFYNGRSKSFATLAHASSAQDLAKLENAYTRRRRNLLASSLIWDKNRFTFPPLRSNGGGISKKTPTNFSKTNLALAVAMTATSSEVENSSTTAWRSFSMADLQCANTTNSSEGPSLPGRAFDSTSNKPFVSRLC